MKNDELKKKIVNIVAMAILEADELPFVETAEYVADALIAAGIGDVKESENKATAAELVAQVSASTAIEKIAESEHRAEVAERALSSLVHEMYEHDIRPMCDEKFFIESRLKEVEKELAEEGK